MSAPCRLVLDASVALKWYLPDDEPGAENLAEQLLVAINDSHIAATVPTLFWFEVCAALSRGFHRRLQAGHAAPLTERALMHAVDALFDESLERVETSHEQLSKAA